MSSRRALQGGNGPVFLPLYRMQLEWSVSCSDGLVAFEESVPGGGASITIPLIAFQF